MILLNGHSLTPARRVPLEAMSLSLKETDSTASITTADMSGIKIKSWMRDDTNPGKNIVWRVRSMRQAYATQTTTVQLEHIISTLKDVILFGEVTTATLAGKKGADTVTAKKAVQYILGKQDDWVLGKFEYSDSNPYKFDGETLFDALMKIKDSLEDAMWTYDMTVYPFKLNFIKAPAGVDSELRAGRNLKTISRNVDKNGMFTRFYPIGKNDLHIPDPGYVQKNTGSYGVVSKVETDQTLDTVSELKRWARERLKKHAEPTVTIEADAFELADATGEPMDRLTLGRICRVPLPEFDTNIQERIVSLDYKDKIHQPESVKITLANTKKDLTKILADAIKKTGGGSRYGARKDKEDNAWFEDTDEHVAMCAKGIIGTDKNGNPNWERLSRLAADGTGIHSTVTDLVDGAKKNETRFNQNEKAIGMVVGTYPNGKNFVKAGEICLAINESGESTATINANKIYLLGDTIAKKITADYISSKIATIPTLNGLAATFSGNVSVKTALFAQYIYLGTGVPYKNMADGINEVRINGPTSNTYKLQYKTWNQSEWQDAGSFSRAIASWTVGWSNGKFTATASPQSQDVWTEVMGGTPSWTGRTVQIPLMAVDSTDYYNPKDTGRSVSATYTLAKADIDLQRSSRHSSEPSTDGTITNLPVTQSGWWIFTTTAAGTEKTYKLRIEHSVNKSDIDLTRSSRHSSEPSTDGTITNLPVTQDGWWVFTAEAAGTTKTFKMKIDYSVPKSSIDLTRSARYDTEPSTDGTITNLPVVQDGWWVFTVSVGGTTKTFKLRITV